MSIVVMNPIELGDTPVHEAVAQWDRFADFFARQPGYVSATLHRAVDDSAKFGLVTLAHWESADAFLAAVSQPELMEIAEDGPSLASSPAIYEVIRG